MRIEKTKSPHQPARFTAWLRLAGGQLHGCVLSNASEDGAQIEVQDSKIVPDHFTLLLSNSGSAQRQCRVVWRRATEVGVTFGAASGRRQ